MTRALACALASLLAAPVAGGEGDSPPWMPGAPPRIGGQSAREREARRLRHEAALFAGVGVGVVALGVAVDVVALDVPQEPRSIMHGDGTLVTQNRIGSSNWVELALGSALLGTGLILVVVGILRARQARALEF